MLALPAYDEMSEEHEENGKGEKWLHPELGSSNNNPSFRDTEEFLL